MEESGVVPTFTEEERKKVQDDDTLMWRALMIALVAIHVRRAQGEKSKEVKFLLEQPAEPDEMPEVVSWWRTREWKELMPIYGWEEVTFYQGDFGGKAAKPTTVGGDLLKKADDEERQKKKGGWKNEVRTSKDLERWAPGMMRMVAKEIVAQIQRVTPHVRVLSWDEHIQMNHTPFRRDCKICQETRQKQNPHRRVGHPLAGVLSLDTAGPYRDGFDLVMKSRYLMVGAFTWLVPKDFTKLREPEVVVEDGAPEVEMWRDGRHGGGEDEDARSPGAGPQDGEKTEEERLKDARSPGTEVEMGRRKNMRLQRLPDPRDRDPKEGRKKTRQIGRSEFSVWRFRWPPRRQKKP